MRFPQFNARTLGFTYSAGLLMAAGAVAAVSSTNSDPTPTLQDQIQADVKHAIHANAAAQTSLEWRMSGYRPSEIFANVRDLNTPDGPKALCEGLNSLPAVDLALFEDEISDPENADILPCASELEMKVSLHWAESRKMLAAHFPKNPRTGSGSDIPQLPSIEVEVNAAEGPLLSRGGLPKGQVAFTFDDGPHGTRTPRVLEILKAAGVRAVFFELGENTVAVPEISKQVADAGHIVGSHTWSHPQLPKLTTKDAESEIRRGREAVEIASGTSIPFFRFPYGARSKYLDSFVKSEGMASFLWNMDTLDWKLRDPKILLKNVLAELDREKGGILLFHDVHEQTVIVLPHVLEELKKRGYTTVLFIPK